MKTYFWPRDLLMQPIITIWTISVRNQPGTIPVEFGKIPVSGSSKEVVSSFPFIIQCKIVTPGVGSILTQGPKLNNFGRGPLDDAITNYERSRPCSFRQEDFWKRMFWPRDLLMQPTETFWTTLAGDYPGIIPVNIGQNRMSCFRGEYV